MFDRLPDAVGNGGLRHHEADQPAAGVRNFQAALPAGAKQTAQRLRQFTQLGKRGLQVGILDADLDRIGARGKAGIADLGLAQHATDFVAHLIELFLFHVVGIDFEQQV